MTVTQPPIKVRPDVLAVPPYRQGSTLARSGFKLSSNENPFPPLPAVAAAVARRGDYNRYIAPDVAELRTAIAAWQQEQLHEHLLADSAGAHLSPKETAQRFKTAPELSAAHVHVGAGSVAILYQLIGAVAGHGDNYVYAWPSFEAYPLLGTVSGAAGRAVPLAAGARHDLAAFVAAVDERTRAVLLCSPNNPTGPTITTGEFHKFMAQLPTDLLVVLDEAYAEFVTDENAVKGFAHLGRYPNLVVLKTFAKAQGLAGLRLGYGMAAPEIWAAVRPAGIPMSINALAETAALATLSTEGQRQLRERIAELTVRREQLSQALTALGLELPQAQGNFVWVPAAQLQRGAGASTDADAAVTYADFLAQRGLLVRPFAGHGVRISVGEAESITAVAQTTAEFLTGETQ